MSTDTFDARARSAGSALRAAFLQESGSGGGPDGVVVGSPTMTTTTPPIPVQPLPVVGRERRRPAAWAAAAALVGVVGTAATIAVTAGDDDSDRLTPARSPGVVFEGLPGRPDYPITYTVPPSLRAVESQVGTRVFEVVDALGVAGVALMAVETVDGVRAADLPPDVSSVLQDRDDLHVFDVQRTLTLSKDSAHVFRLTPRPDVAQRPVWCAGLDQCWVLVPGKTTIVVVLQTSAGPLFVMAEYAPDAREAAEDAGKELLDRVQIR